MKIAALVFFLLAGLLGAFLLTYVLRNKNTPKGVAILHGSMGATGILLLAFAAYTFPWLVVYFCLVALGGIILFLRDITGRSIPSWLALGHGFLAITGVFILVLFLFFIK